MNEEKVYTCQSKTQLWAPLAMFFFGAFWFVKAIVVMVHKGAYDTIDFMWVRGRMLFISSDMYPELEKYLIQ